jgi:hypothetical protein
MLGPWRLTLGPIFRLVIQSSQCASFAQPEFWQPTNSKLFWSRPPSFRLELLRTDSQARPEETTQVCAIALTEDISFLEILFLWQLFFLTVALLQNRQNEVP